MNQPKWLGLNQVLFIHQKVIDYTGGSRLVRDQRLLESAINRPKNLYAYQEDCDLFDLAAMYAGRHWARSRSCRWKQANGRCVYGSVFAEKWFDDGRQK